VLTAIVVGSDGIEHARLTSAYDTTQRKTLSVAVLTGTRQFTPVQMRAALVG
jgi:hypothetical protein